GLDPRAGIVLEDLRLDAPGEHAGDGCHGLSVRAVCLDLTERGQDVRLGDALYVELPQLRQYVFDQSERLLPRLVEFFGVPLNEAGVQFSECAGLALRQLLALGVLPLRDGELKSSRDLPGLGQADLADGVGAIAAAKGVDVDPHPLAAVADA